MPRPRSESNTVYWIIAVTVAAAIVIAGSIYLANSLSSKPSAKTNCPSGNYAAHHVVIQNDSVMPEHTTGHRCDRLVITNLDGTNRLVAFGVHEHHTPYDGVTEELLSRGQSLRVTMVKTGNFRFHDHLHDEVQGTFTVH